VDGGFGESFDAFVDHAARFYRNGFLPFVGSTAITGAPSVTETAWAVTEARGTIVSSSADLGCTYGVARSTAVADASDTQWSASYYRIWRRNENSAWRVVIDVLIPIAPSNQ
jgi:hypothetical protein